MRIEGNYEYAETADDLRQWGKILAGDEQRSLRGNASWARTNAEGYDWYDNRTHLIGGGGSPFEFRRPLSPLQARQPVEHFI